MDKLYAASEWQKALALVRPKVETYGYDYAVETSLERGPDLLTMGRAMGRLAASTGVEYEAVGGQGVYASALAVAMCMTLKHRTMEWFTLRPEAKDHGTKSAVEGARIGGRPVFIVDTVAKPDALLEACITAERAGAKVTGILPVLDFDPGVLDQIADRFPGAVFEPLFTPKELQ